jgi:hypothetical protein
LQYKINGLFAYSFQFKPIEFAEDIFFCEGTIIQATTLILKGFAISTFPQDPIGDDGLCYKCIWSSVKFSLNGRDMFDSMGHGEVQR